MPELIVTIPSSPDCPTMVWDVSGTPCVHAYVDSYDDAVLRFGALECWYFDMFSTTLEPGTTSGTEPASDRRVPLTDADGNPLWPGAEIEIRSTTPEGEIRSFEAVFKFAHSDGKIYFRAKIPGTIPSGVERFKGDVRGAISAVFSLRTSDELGEHHALYSDLGDRVRSIHLIDDPRSICIPHVNHWPSLSR